MKPGDDHRRQAGGALFAALLVVSLSLPASAVALGDSGGRKLSSRLAELAKPSVRRAPRAEQAERLSLAVDGPGSLLRDGGRVLAYVRFERGAADGADDLSRAGAEIAHVSRRYQTVTVAVRPADLPAVAAVDRVERVTEVLAPVVSATSCAGLVTSAGDAQLRADLAREGFNLDGGGVRVGILSDSFDTDPFADTHAAEDVASGDLPGSGNPCGRTTPVSVFEDLDEPGETIDEGRAMAQIVHDLAPGAAIDFATAFVSELGFADNIRALQEAGADVIADDVFYLEEPFFQDGPVAVAVDDVTAVGATYFSAAGNSNLIDAEGNDIDSWEAPAFRDTACPPELEAMLEAEVCMDFDPGPEPDPTFEITVEPGGTLLVDLQWKEPWEEVTADLDVFLLDEEDKPLFFGSDQDNVGSESSEGTQRPFEAFAWENELPEPPELPEPKKVRLAISRCIGACNPNADSEAKPRLKFALIQNGGGVTETEYPKSAEGDVVGPTIFGHTAAAGALSVAAVPVSDSSIVEEYSSRGPVTLYFGPVAGVTPAEELKPPVDRGKPDLAASDCGLTTFFVPTLIPGIHRFCGTSAAAPHAAAVAALMREANPSLSVAQLRTALATTARPVGPFEADAVVGAGLVDAFEAVSRVALPPKITIADRPPQLTNNPSPSIGFTANRPVTFSCSLDGGAPLPCSSPFTPPVPLVDGPHGFLVSGIDIASRTGTSDVVVFTIDTRPPRTFFRARPRRKIRTKRRRVTAAFRFGSNEKESDFICRVDGGLFRFCPERFARKFRLGRHVVRVKARDAAGNVDPSPAVYRFRVKLRGTR